MARLAGSLVQVWRELDAAWPARDRRTDGWIRLFDPVVPNSDHIPDAAGWVHAIDIDKDGIDADYVVSVLIKRPTVTNYVIWNRHIWSASYGMRKRHYTGTSNPHTDHIHHSIHRTAHARGFDGPWGIFTDFKLPKKKPPIDVAARDLDYSRPLIGIEKPMRQTTATLLAAANSIRSYRATH